MSWEDKGQMNILPETETDLVQRQGATQSVGLWSRQRRQKTEPWEQNSEQDRQCPRPSLRPPLSLQSELLITTECPWRDCRSNSSNYLFGLWWGGLPCIHVAAHLINRNVGPCSKRAGSLWCGEDFFANTTLLWWRYLEFWGMSHTFPNTVILKRKCFLFINSIHIMYIQMYL